MGRPTKLTPETQAVIIEALENGNYAETAATLGGISHDTFYTWIRKGEDGVEPYAAFADATKRASAKAEAASLASVRAQSDSWQASAWFLERRFPAKYAKREPDYDLKTKQLKSDLAKSKIEIETLKAKLELLKTGHDPDAQNITVVIPEALRRDGE